MAQSRFHHRVGGKGNDPWRAYGPRPTLGREYGIEVVKFSTGVGNGGPAAPIE